MEQDKQKILTTTQASEITGLSRNTIKKYARLGKIRAYKKKGDRNMYFLEDQFKQDIAELEKLMPYEDKKN